MKRILFLLFFGLLLNLVNAQSNNIPGEFLVQLKGKHSAALIERNMAINHPEWEMKATRLLSARFHIWLFTSLPGDDAEKLSYLSKDSKVVLAQHNHQVQLRSTVPNDPSFTQQWALNNTAQSGGTAGADIQAEDAWDITTGGLTTSGDTIVVAVIDGGFQLNHPDLVQNIFVNRLEIPGNSIDDDGNGYVDDVNGWNAYDDNGTIPSDQHGTHVSGIIGARGNNNIGIAGVNWAAKILPIAGSSGDEATVVAAYAYAAEMRIRYNESNGLEGAYVVSTNASFGVDQGDPADYPIWCSFYDTLGTYGILNAGATANANFNIDQTGDIPTACVSQFLIAVTNSTNADVKYNSAGYGVVSIDIASPGTAIYSTVTNSNYGNLTGTSMATPHVAGAIGLMYGAACEELIAESKSNPASVALAMRNYLLDGAEQLSSLNNLVDGSRRLNLLGALQQVQSYICDPTAPPSANFSAPAPSRNGCPGLSVTFLNQSSANANSYSWEFPGGNPATSTEENPVVVYNSVGVFPVQLIANNDFGADTIQFPNYVDVNTSGTRFVLNETFDAATFTEAGWSTVNPDNASTWILATVGGSSPGTQAAEIPIFANQAAIGQRDGLISPELSLLETSSNSLYFEHAHRRRVTSVRDSLILAVSTDQGANWTRIAAYAESGQGSFATGNLTTSNFVPTANINWCTASTTGPDCFTLDISAWDGAPSFLVKFEAYNAGGNNIFIDNVKVSGICSNPVIVQPQAAFAINTDPTCTNQPIQFTNSSTDATSYSWSFPGAFPSTSTEISPTVLYAAAGTYSVQLIASNSQYSDTLDMQSFVTVQESPAPPLLTFGSETISTAAVGSFQWLFNGVVIPNATTSQLTPTQSGDYTCVVTSPNGCSASSTMNIIIDGLEQLANSNLSIYPNPVEHDLTIKLNSPETALCTLFDASGRKLISSTVVSSGIIDMKEYPAGVYILSVIVNGQQSHHKIIHTSALAH
ncbi:MAG TPA: S8 family serine peptidase [Flavobacteriales bacterium]|nr:S8 family serine peptidase [Flavobacteriales bacterium]HPH83253.1 S8 family serine peptidase [Flavobacteriales bacterium]